MAWPLVLLAALLVGFRHDRGGAAAAVAADCESPASLDNAALEACLAADAINVELVAEAAARAANAGDPARAAALYRRALSLDPHDGELQLRLGEVLIATGDRQGARGAAAAALAAEPGSLAAEDLLHRAAPEAR